MVERRGAPGLAVVAVAFGATLARTLRPPDTYALGHWLLTYAHGPIKRGLVGSLVAPLLRWKTPAEARFVVETLALLLLFGLVAALVASMRPLLRAEAPPLTRAALFVAALAMATSPWAVFAAHTNGFLDHGVELVTLVALAAVGTRWRHTVPLLAAVGLAMHEMFLVYGLPVVVLAVALDAGPRGGRAVLRALCALAAPVAIVGAVLAWGFATMPAAEIQALRDEVAAVGIIGGEAADNAVFHLTHGLVESAGMQHATVWQRLGRVDLAWLAGPPTLLFLGWAVAGLGVGARRWIAALPLVFAPLLLHVVAWDTERFTLLVIFAAFTAWLVVFRRMPVPVLGRLAWIPLAFGLLVIANNVARSVPLMDEQRDGDGPISLRSAPSLASFSGCTPVFPNAGFESGTLDPWVADGAAFAGPLRPAKNARGPGKQVGSLGKWWVGSYGLAPVQGQPPGDGLTGRLSSPAFPVRGDVLGLTVGGGNDPADLRVSLIVDGEEVAWATGGGADAMRPMGWAVADYRGRSARIELVDNATGRWGHINVDGFCWLNR